MESYMRVGVGHDCTVSFPFSPARCLCAGPGYEGQLRRSELLIFGDGILTIDRIFLDLKPVVTTGNT